MSIRRPSITLKIDGHRYALWEDMPFSKDEAISKMKQLKKKYQSVRIIRLKTGWFIYHYPQYLEDLKKNQKGE